MQLPARPLSARSNLRDEVASTIREGIFSGALRPGDKIDQDAIAAQLGVSKLPVRESLIALESEGLVETLARRGAFVAPLTADDFLDHYRMFGLITAIAVERAAKSITPEQLAHMESLLVRMEAWTERDSGADSERLNFQFHRVAHAAGGTRRLKAELRSLSKAMPENLYHRTRGWTPAAQQEHRHILEALMRGDGESAAAAQRGHVDAGAIGVIDMLRANGFWD